MEQREYLVAMSLRPGTGGCRGANGVKTAKLCVEQDQIGKRSLEQFSELVIRKGLPGKIAKAYE